MPTRAMLFVVALTSAVELGAQEEDYEYQDSVVVLETLEEVMARPEFERLRRPETDVAENPAWLERFLDWLEEWLAGDVNERNRSLGRGEAYLVYGVVLLVVLGVLAFLLKSILAAPKEATIAVEGDEGAVIRAGAAPGETPPEEFWNNAQALAASGNYKAAIRELLLGAMSTLERRGLVRHRRGLTNRDYLVAATGAVRESLHTIVGAFELVYFGRRRATADGFDACSRAYRRSFAAGDERALGTEST